MLKKEWSSA